MIENYFNFKIVLDDNFNNIRNTKDGNAICNGEGSLDGASLSKFWLAKINVTGDTLWQNSYYGNNVNANYGGNVATAEDNGFISTLYEYNGLGLLSTSMMRLDSVGNVIWARKFDGVNSEIFSSILTTSDTNYVAMGYTNSFGSGGYDIFIVKCYKLRY